MSNSTCAYFDFDSNTNNTVPCNNVEGSKNLLSGNVEFTNYGYLLNKPASDFFISAFSILLLAQILLGVYWKTWWTLYTLALGTLVEMIGWIGRILSVNTLVWDPNSGGIWVYDFNDFIIQICCLVIGPTFFSAGNYILLGHLLHLTNPMYSSLDIRSFRIIFITADVLCLIVQAAGGAYAGTANTSQGSNNGAYVMTAGVVLQLVITLFYIVLYVEWVQRWRLDKPVTRQYRPFEGKKAKRSREGQAVALHSFGDSSAEHGEVPSASSAFGSNKGASTPRREKQRSFTTNTGERPGNGRVGWMAGMIAFSTLLIVIRSIYRSAELANGWVGPIAVNEPLFLGLDATMMFILVLSYSLLHPGLALGRRMF